MSTWKDIREALLFQLPSTKVEFLRQPLLWNPFFTDNYACVLGIRPHLSWGKMDSGAARSMVDWERFQSLSNEEKKTIFVFVTWGMFDVGSHSSGSSQLSKTN